MCERTWKELEAAGVPSIVRAGPDLFSQPEVLFLVGALVLSAGGGDFYGSSFDPKSLPKQVRDVLDCDPNAEAVLKAAAQGDSGGRDWLSAETWKIALDFAAHALHERIANGKTWDRGQVGDLKISRSAGILDLYPFTPPRFSTARLSHVAL